MGTTNQREIHVWNGFPTLNQKRGKEKAKLLYDLEEHDEKHSMGGRIH